MRENVKLGLLAGVVAVGAMLLASPDADAQPGPENGDQVVAVDGGGAWVRLPWCDAEDGRVDGRVCMWVDPDSGDGFVVTSENYR